MSDQQEISGKLRETAQQLRQAANVQLEAAIAVGGQLASQMNAERAKDDDGSLLAAMGERLIKSFAAAIIGQGQAIVMETEAGIRDEIQFGAVRAGMTEERRRAMERSNAIRQASATGQWELFDELVDSELAELLKSGNAARPADGDGGTNADEGAEEPGGT